MAGQSWLRTSPLRRDAFVVRQQKKPVRRASVSQQSHHATLHAVSDRQLSDIRAVVAAADVEVHWVAAKPPLLAHESEFYPFNVLGGECEVDHEVPP